ncbi:MAG: MaoC family dehydratase N-terminal domain-containing protein [Mycobacterium sp.]
MPAEDRADPSDRTWRGAWDAMISAVGTDLSDGDIVWGADAVEPGTIRRYCEPLELGCLLHHDPAVAAKFGYTDVISPYTAALSWTVPAMWQPGRPTLYDTPERDAQPARSPINNPDPGPAPPTTGFFATDMELDFLRPVLAGERLGKRGQKLLSCAVKETSVGRGAFLTFESEIVSDKGDVVARYRNGVYAYNPHPS